MLFTKSKASSCQPKDFLYSDPVANMLQTIYGLVFYTSDRNNRRDLLNEIEQLSLLIASGCHIDNYQLADYIWLLGKISKTYRNLITSKHIDFVMRQLVSHRPDANLFNLTKILSALPHLVKAQTMVLPIVKTKNLEN